MEPSNLSLNPVKVSVVMLSYNNEAYIREAIEAVLAQDVDFACELIICDDNSSDKSMEIVKSISNTNPFFNVLCFKQDFNLGMGLNFDFALRRTNGEYIAMCDGDDKWVNKDRLKEQVHFLDMNPGYGIICGDMDVIDETGKFIDWPPLKDLRTRYRSGDIFFKQLISTSINTLTAVFRRDLMLECFSEKPKWYLADLWIWLRVSMKSKVYHQDKIYGNYRRHDNNITKESNLISSVNKARLFCILYDNVIFYCKNYFKPTGDKEQSILFIVLIKLLANKNADLQKRLILLSYIIRISLKLRDIRGTIKNRKTILNDYLYS